MRQQGTTRRIAARLYKVLKSSPTSCSGPGLRLLRQGEGIVRAFPPHLPTSFMNRKAAACLIATALAIPMIAGAADTSATSEKSRAQVVNETKRAEAAGTMKPAGQAVQPIGATGDSSSTGTKTMTHAHRRHHRHRHHTATVSRTSTTSLQPAGQAPQSAGQSPQK